MKKHTKPEKRRGKSTTHGGTFKNFSKFKIQHRNLCNSYIIKIQLHIAFKKFDHTHSSGLYHHHLLFSVIFCDNVIE